MLLFSYIIVAALELVMTITTIQSGNITYAWSFGFLLTLSILSIPLETSEIGKTVRNEFKNLGIDTAKYDLIANNGRSLSYLLIVGGIISQIQGLIMAYGITIYMLILAVWKYTQVIKK